MNIHGAYCLIVINGWYLSDEMTVLATSRRFLFLIYLRRSCWKFTNTPLLVGVHKEAHKEHVSGNYVQLEHKYPEDNDWTNIPILHTHLLSKHWLVIRPGSNSNQFLTDFSSCFPKEAAKTNVQTLPSIQDKATLPSESWLWTLRIDVFVVRGLQRVKIGITKTRGEYV